MALDTAAFDAAVRGGQARALLAALERSGVVMEPRLGQVGFQLHGLAEMGDAIAMDAQPELVTISNAGIPAFLSNYLDPKLIEVLVSPMKAAQIYGEQKKGDWTTTVTTFPVVESEGEVSSYGDFNANGNVDVNTNFPQRQSYHYQTFTQWGEKELAVAALAKIDWANRLNIASVLLLNKFQNKTYFFGVDGLALFGALNDPALYAPIAPTAPWNDPTTTAEQVYEDIRRLFVQAQSQANGTIDQGMNMCLAMSPEIEVALAKTNQFNVNVTDMLKKNFPKMRVETAVEFSTGSGELVQLIIEEIEGQETATTGYTEKMRAHAVVVDTSAFKQKKSQGTWGTIIFRPFAIAQMIGV